MDYLHEHIFIGRVGVFATVLFFVSSLFSAFYYIRLAYTSSTYRVSINQKATIFWVLHFVSIVLIFASLYLILTNHYFEYHYAYQHSNRDLPFRYILSCFWEGQEGSFLLWAFWNAVLGFVFFFAYTPWRARVLSLVSLFQVLLASMVLGLSVSGVNVGNNPFELLRQEMANAPLFLQPNYLEYLKDGVGLNALLQNYWMVIHPPVLFLGFALFTYPFAFVLSGLLTREYTLFKKDVLAWSLLALAVLGLGIMMGAAWAYESLTFGGYWAWDPVENASLVPWLMLLAALHLNLVYHKTGRLLRLTILFYLLSFILIIYATYLTRSGVLGDTSVHAFTGAGIETQLLLVLLICALPTLGLYVYRYKHIPFVRNEEKVSSREFIMFLGAIILCLSAFIIILKTSLPILNKIAHTQFAPPSDTEFSYNSNQIFVALLVTFLSGLAFFFQFRHTSFRVLYKPLLPLILLSLLLSVCLIYMLPIDYLKKGIGFYYVLLLTLTSSVFAILSNAYYLLFILKGRILQYGGPLAHLGFAILILGILISSSKKTILSWNTTGFSPLKEGQGTEKPLENITLIKDIQTDMGAYDVTYLGHDSVDKRTKTYFYKILFQHKEHKKQFILYPDVIQNTKNQEGLTPNPDALHLWNKDIFAYLTYVKDLEEIKDTSHFMPRTLLVQDTFYYSAGFITLTDVSKSIHPDVLKRYHLPTSEKGISASLLIHNQNGSLYTARPSIWIREHDIVYLPDSVLADNLVFNFDKVKTPHKFQISFKESSTALDFVTLKVLVFPYIHLVWLGTIVMVIGTLLSALKRYYHTKALTIIESKLVSKDSW